MPLRRDLLLRQRLHLLALVTGASQRKSLRRRAASEGTRHVAAAQGERFEMLLGRRTYDIWSGYRPKAPMGWRTKSC
jgi:hypothetical protein